MKFLGQTLGIALGAGLMALFLSAGVGVAAPLTGVKLAPPSAESTCDSSRAIHVSGSAAINVVPDRALVQLGVVTPGLTAGDAQAANQAVIQRVVEAIRGLGIEDKDIATDYYVVQPVYNDYDNLTIDGYRVSNVVGVTVREVSQTGEVLVAAFNAGANQVNNVEFYTSELRRYRDEARQLAMTAAVEKARDLAEAGGAQVGCLLTVNENSWSYYSGNTWWGGGRDQAMWSQNVVQNAPGGDSPGGGDDTPVSVGQIAVKAEVSASYSLQ
jgi:uncharacterized protein